MRKDINMSSARKWKDNDDFIKCWVISMLKNNVEHPHCVSCYEVLSNDAVGPNRPEGHFVNRSYLFKGQIKGGVCCKI